MNLYREGEKPKGYIKRYTEKENIIEGIIN